MRKTFFASIPGLLSNLSFLFFLLQGSVSYAQNPFPCPPQIDFRTTNPDFPGCKAPGGRPFNVLLVVDESGSISNAGAANTVKNAVTGFANILNTGTSGTGKIQMGIVEFSNVAQVGVPLTDVRAANFNSTVASYLATGYTANGPSTNYVAALTTASGISNVDIIFFITDGAPYPTVDVNNWRSIANAIKCGGTYIFGIGVGTSSATLNANIQMLSGPDELNIPTLTLQNGADWTRQPFTNLGPLLIDLANSLVDAEAPVVTCPGQMQANNDAKVCFAKVNYTTTVSDNCPDVTLVCTPPSGGFFMVGQTSVTCKATDKVGTTSTCTFRITVLDVEPPEIFCPDNITVSCEVALDPANTGDPTTIDNCAIGNLTKADQRIDGACANDYTVKRTWTAVDVHFNMSTCMQVIKVEDKTSPSITCPANITVSCDTSVLKTGVATATDNCLPRPTLSRSDAHVSGDCDWFCITDRTWVATDACLNTSKCVQRITKDVTPLIEQALTGSPLVMGQAGATATLTKDHANCVVKWFPYNEVLKPQALKFDDAVAGADCKLMSNPLDAAGHIENPLLGAAMELSLLVRINPALGTKKLSTFPCTMHFIIKQSLANNPDVNELLRVSNLTIGNINVNLLMPESAMLLLNYIQCIIGDKTVCNPN